jgi:predicted nucleotidyltransferase
MVSISFGSFIRRAILTAFSESTFFETTATSRLHAKDQSHHNQHQVKMQKTVGLADPLRQALQAMSDKIQAAFVYGSVTKKTDTANSDIELMVIADDLSYGAFFTALEETSVTLGHPVNPSILSRDEFHDRVAKQESFLTRVMEQPKIWILGEEGDLSV